MIQAPTGTGKTLAYVLPLLDKVKQEDEKLNGRKRTAMHAVIICPTQELALQTHAQLHTLLGADANPASVDPSYLPEGDNAATFLGLGIGGFHEVAVQRHHLRAHPPAILIGTPRRLNEIFFPHYATHGSRQDKRKREERQVIEDPIEDEIVEVDAEQMKVVHVEHEEWDARVDHVLQDASDRNRYQQSRTLAESRSKSMEEEVKRRKHAHDDDDDYDPSEYGIDADGVDTLFLPSPNAVGYEAQRFLHMPSRVARMKVRTPLKSICLDLKYMVIDEADEVLKPMSKFAGKKMRENRIKHPKPSHVLVRGLRLMNPAMQLIAVSATINAPFRILVKRLGFRRPQPVHIKIAAREQGETQKMRAEKAAMALQQAAGLQPIQQLEANSQLHPSSNSTSPTSASTDARPLASHPSSSNPLAAANPSSLATPDERDGRVGLPLSMSLMYSHECPPNLSHFYVIAPSYTAWLQGRHAEIQKFPTKLKYDHAAEAEERQRVHQHNLNVKLKLRRDAFILDKLCSLHRLLAKFKPKCPLLVVDTSKFKLSDISSKLSQLNLRPALLYQHLSGTNVDQRTAFLEQLRSGAYDVLLVAQDSIRGIDLPMCDLVVCMEAIREPQLYLHAAGRTGRLGRPGSVLTLLHPEELGNYHTLRRFMPQTLSAAQQLLLPKNMPRDVYTTFLLAYDTYRHEKERQDREVEKEIKMKLKRRVQPDTPAEQQVQPAGLWK